MSLLSKVFLCLCLTCVIAHADEQGLLKKIRSHLLIGDPASAAEFVRNGFSQHFKSPAFYIAAVEAFAAAGDEKAMLSTWNDYQRIYSKDNESLAELMAWAIIAKAAQSPSPIVRHCGLLAAFLGQDAKSVPLIQQYCFDANSHVRMTAVRIASQMRDAPLQDAMLQLMQSEKDRKVRCEVIKAVGKMNIAQSQPHLLAILADDRTSLDEKTSAAKSLIHLLDELARPELIKLVSSNRAGLKLLACQVAAHTRNIENSDLLIALLSDNHPEVREAALYALGLLDGKHKGSHDLLRIAKQHLKDPCVDVAIVAAWLVTILEPTSSPQAFAAFFQHKSLNVRLTAAGALVATGQFGLPFLMEIFQRTDDSLVKMNLALGLIQQQVDVPRACQALHSTLANDSSRWAWSDRAHFRFVQPTSMQPAEDIDEDPETVNMLVRLELLNILAMMKYPQAQEAIKKFLQQKRHGITGMAAALLLTEGDESALQLVQNLLDDPNPQIRLEASLILALWGREEKAAHLLQESYATADREKKEQLLEGIGRVGLRSSVPFLIDRLQESQPTLRLIASAALLQCLYH